jgi:hypothetical protein
MTAAPRIWSRKQQQQQRQRQRQQQQQRQQEGAAPWVRNLPGDRKRSGCINDAVTSLFRLIVKDVSLASLVGPSVKKQKIWQK